MHQIAFNYYSYHTNSLSYDFSESVNINNIAFFTCQSLVNIIKNIQLEKVIRGFKFTYIYMQYLTLILVHAAQRGSKVGQKTAAG